jgi:hypothetical protein
MAVVQCDSMKQWQYNADSKGLTNPGRERLDGAEVVTMLRRVRLGQQPYSIAETIVFKGMKRER